MDAAQYAEYKLPDPWKEATKPVCGVVPVSAIFKSKTPRAFQKGMHAAQRQEGIFHHISPPRDRPHSSQEITGSIFESSTFSNGSPPRAISPNESFIDLPGDSSAYRPQSFGQGVDLENSQVSSFFESQQHNTARPSTEPNRTRNNKSRDSNKSRGLHSSGGSGALSPARLRTVGSAANKMEIMPLRRMRSRSPGFSFLTATTEKGS